MTLLTDGRPAPAAPAEDLLDQVGRGFRDCRGVWHRLDRDDDGGQD